MPAAARMSAHERLAHGREVALLLLGKAKAERSLGIYAAVLRDESLDPCLEIEVQHVPSGAHVGELGIAADGRNDVGAQCRISGRDFLVAAIAMPELVAELEQPLAVLAREDTVTGPQVRDIGEPRTVEAHALLRPYGGIRRLQLTEALREGKLLRGRERRAAPEHEHGITVHRIFNGRRVF